MDKQKTFKLKVTDILLFTLIFLFTFVVFYFINIEISKKMLILKQEAMEYLESKIGKQISYESISPSIFMYLEIRDLRIYNFNEYDNYLLKINKIHINYNIFTLFFNNDPLTAISEINIRNSQFQIDWERDREIINLVQSFRFLEPEEEYNIKLSGSNLDFNFSQNDFVYELKKVFFNITDNEDIIAFNLDRADFILYLKKENNFEKQIESIIKTSGTLDKNSELFDLQLTLSELSTEYFSMSNQTFQVLYQSNEIHVTKIKDKAPIDINLVCLIDELQFWVDFKTEDFNLADELVFENNFKFINNWIPENITGFGNIFFDLKENLLDYNLYINAKLTNEITPSGIYISSSVYGNRNNIFFDPLYISSNTGNAKFSGNINISNLLPEGTLNLVDIECPSGYKLNALFNINRTGKYTNINSTNITIGIMKFNEFNFDITTYKKTVDFFLNADIAESFDNNRIIAKGGFDFTDNKNPETFLNIDLKNISIMQIFNIFSPFNPDYINNSEVLSSLALNTEIRLKSNFNNTEISSNYLKIRDYNNPYNYLITSFSFTNEYFNINDFHAVLNENTISGYLNADFINTSPVNRNQINITTEIVANHNPYLFEIQYVDGYGIIFKGPYNLSGSIQKSFNRYLISFKTDKFLIPLKDRYFFVSMNISGTLDNNQKLFLDSSSLTFYDLPFIEAKESLLFLSFYSYNSIIIIENIKYSDNISKLNGSGNINLNSLNNIYGNINLSDPEQKELYYTEYEISDSHINMLFNFNKLPVSRFGSNILSGEATGTVKISNTLQDPNYDMNLSLNNGRFLNDPIAVSIQASLNNDRINIDSFDGYYLNHNFKNTSAWYNNNTGNFSLKTNYNSEYFTNTIQSNIIFTGTISDITNQRIKSNANNILLTKNIDANLLFTENIINDIETPELSVSFFTEENTFYILEDKDNSIKGFITYDNDFEFDLYSPLPLTCSVNGKINDNTIDAEINNINFDMKLLNSLIDKNVLEFVNGTADGYISISGLINDPDFNGKLNTQNVAVAFYMSPDTTDNFSTTLLIQEKIMRMDLIQTHAGNASVFAEGNFIFSHWVISEYDLDFWTDYNAGLHIIHDFGSVFVDGYAIGKINLIGDEYSIDINSDILVNYCKITMSDEEQEVNYNYDDIPYKVNLNMKSGKNVDFLWPSFRLPIFRTNVKLGSELTVNYNDIQQELNVEGDVDLISGDVFYFNRNFYIRSGKISFNEHTDQIDPRITLEAEIREIDQNNDEIKIYLIVNNRKLSEFEPEFRSEPSKSYLEITSILGAPLQQQFSENAGISALLLSSDFVSQFGLIRPFEQRIRETFNLDLFSIRTQIIQSVLFRRLIEENNNLASNESFNEYLNNTTITLGKYLGEDIFFEALVNLKREMNQQISTELFLSVEFPTPFFNIEWELSPKFNNTNDLYPISNSITLSWDLSF